MLDRYGQASGRRTSHPRSQESNVERRSTGVTRASAVAKHWARLPGFGQLRDSST